MISKEHYKVITVAPPNDPIKGHELRAATILVNHFKHDGTILRPGNRKTADIKIGRVVWELKSPVGDGKNTMANNLRAATDQSENIVIDLSRCKMNYSKAISRIRYYIKSGPHHIKRLLIITKTGRVIDFFQGFGRI